MEIYLFIVVILFILAISDLVVGVSNDAVNFLNSAIGSKVAPRHIIMIVASLGILVGTTFSQGLMEVARKGIFNPDQFYFPEIMVIFLSVMITDVILLDLYNTFAMPTSTTVSIVFELLGSAVAVSIIKIINAGDGIGELVRFINTSKAFAIISGILLSVGVAFSAGAIFQFITRLIFTFDYEKRIKRYGSLWGGFALTAITFFILIKGAKGSAIITSETQSWIKDNANLILLINFGFWTILLQLLTWFTKVNILKPIVLIGTFALALAFAANDLVNFIGVPLAGLASYVSAVDSANPMEMLMVALTKKVPTNTILLLLAGIIMVVTLWFSKKARSVTKTEVNLSRQTEGFERFESTALSRALVRGNIGILDTYRKVTPTFLQKFILKRFDDSHIHKKKSKNAPAFDLLRASVNLMVASMVISFATSLKLPLSTTYVTFMVAMGTSLSDKAWGRESAVYRITGVLMVIGGWFFTAIMAFTLSGIVATTIYYGDIIAIIVLVLLAAFLVFRTNVLHKRKSKEEDELEEVEYEASQNVVDTLNSFLKDINKFLFAISGIISKSYDGLKNQNREELKDSKKDAKKLKKHTNILISNIFAAVKSLPEDNIKKDRRFGKIIASIQSISNNVRSINQSCFEHFDNNHKIPTAQQLDELNKINLLLSDQIKKASELFEKKDFSDIEEFENAVEDFKAKLTEFDENQVLRIKLGSSTTRGSLLYLGLMGDSENISNDISNMVSLTKKNYSELLDKNK